MTLLERRTTANRAADPAVGAHPPQTDPRDGNLRLSLLLLLSLAIALGSLTGLLGGLAWWIGAVTMIAVVLAACATARVLLRPRWMGTLAGLVTGVVLVTVFFAADTALLGVVPTFDTWERVVKLMEQGTTSINQQGIPAEATPGIMFLLAWLSAAIAVVVDMVAIWWRAPALAGIPLLIILLVPNIVLAELANPFYFVLTGMVYLLLLRPRIRRIQPGLAAALGASALAGAIFVPLILPPIDPTGDGNGRGFVSAEINPIIDLGNDLRRGTPTRALTYTTTANSALYLRLTILEEFRGTEWQPAPVSADAGNEVSLFGAPPGVSEGVVSEPASTNVTIDRATGRWLPVPYPTTSIAGLRGSWSWEPEGLSVRSEGSNMRGQEYTVSSLELKPTSNQLVAAGDSSGMLLAQVPEGLDPVVAQTAAEVVGAAATDYEKALALQDWFRGGEFKYSEDAPVREGFDGSGLDVLAPFLAAKTGYCVHFASAMAVMSRTLGIPSRVVVGFLPGEPSDQGRGETVYEVSSRDLHAWPELFFAGVGWVRFEPTPGRGTEPNYRAAPVDNPDTPGVDESQLTPSAAPVAPGAQPSRAPQDPTAGPNGPTDSAGTVSPWPAAVALLIAGFLLVPAASRIAIRRRRKSAVRRGEDAATEAWRELADSARDLGFADERMTSPRELETTLARDARLNPAATAALSELRSAVEREVYADDVGSGAGSRRHGATPSLEALALVLGGLRGASSRAERVRATLLPKTIIDRALMLRVRTSL